MPPQKINALTNATLLEIPQKEKVNLFRKKLGQKLIFRSSSKSQSAMEYLMTYGWSILIIAVVLVAMWQLGIIGGGALGGPRATAGACQVVRNVQGSNLEGQCTNLIPQFVAHFDGSTGYVNLGSAPQLSPEAGVNGQMTFCMWYKINSLTNYFGPILKGETAPSNGNSWEYTLDQQGGFYGFRVWNQGGSTIASYGAGSQSPNQWLFSCFTYNYPASQAYYYLNGISYPAAWSGTSATAGTGSLVIGAGENGYSQVDASNIQIYNTSLSSSYVQALYKEGIGGDPIKVQNLVGWWPLNGNAYDYSGNYDNGAEVGGVSYIGAWTSGYTPP